MLIDPKILQDVALFGSRGSVPGRMSDDDPTLTYEEVILYLMCRYGSAADFIDPDYEFSLRKNVKNPDWEWDELTASKTHPKVIEHPWDEIFPEYKQALADWEARKKAAEQEEKAKDSIS